MTTIRSSTIAAALVLAAMSPLAAATDDVSIVAALDTTYQEAVKKNDAATMDRILHDDFVLVLGDGRTYRKADLINDARTSRFAYELQDEEAGSQTVRVWGDTAVVTAKLLLKYEHNGKQFERKLWFSDTYVRTPQGWRYVFGQASLPLPRES
ncbi:ketosteroid isomerase-like protein [Povalibacter uvarum]|uniref:Ketosteroid isomerase-like protein n=1 Tax=Povalibacter uvarum TaxID=732238 RepID=A0A841HWC9_9GAMM|nr:nuclear transport factor 2 family protein [Povalibacter uvarum]MBB6096095.1 ketosteroid isomerase-like protein [Povalibacter uvarum]